MADHLRPEAFRNWHLAKFNREYALIALSYLHDGITLKEGVQIERAQNPDFPTYRDIVAWAACNADGDFAKLYATARRAQALHWAEEIMTISDDGSNDWEERRRADGTLGQKVNYECIQRSKLRVDTRRWLLAKLHPDVYAERLQHQTLGANGLPVDPPSNVTPIELSAMLKAWKPKGD